MPLLSSTLFKFQKPPMSLKQFMLRSEVLKLYRGFMRLSRLIDVPPSTSTSQSVCCPTKTTDQGKFLRRNLHPLQVEWIDWVRAEFRLRQGTSNEEDVKMMLAHGKRQLQEIERTILLATNRNSTDSGATPTSSSTDLNSLSSKNNTSENHSCRDKK